MNPSAAERACDPSDSQIVAGVCGGDSEQYRALVERYERKVYAIAWARLGDADLAEEAAHETFIKAYRKLTWLKDGTKFGAWVAAIARHVSINLGLRHRHELVKRERWGVLQEDRCSVDAPAEPEVAGETLQLALANLSAVHRECLVLFYLEGKGIALAAAALGITPSAFKTRLHRARRALRRELETRLEGSLEQLRPARPLAPAVMVLLSGQSLEAAGAGAGLGTLAKLGAALLKLLPFQFLMLAMPIVGLIPAWLLSRVEHRNYRDRDGFRARNYRSAMRKGLVFAAASAGAVYLVILWSEALWGKHSLERGVGVLILAVTVPLTRVLALNRGRFVVGHFAANLTLGLGMIGKGFWGWPEPVFSFCFAGFFGWLAWAMRDLPLRMDYNLFLRQSQRMLPEPAKERPALRAGAAISGQAMFAFARFLAEHWLIADYRKRGADLALRLPPARPRLLPNFFPWFWRGASIVTVSPSGAVRAELGAQDAAALNAGEELGAELEFGVAEALERAWAALREGDTLSAQRRLGAGQETEIFRVAPSRVTRWRQGALVFASIVLALATTIRWVQDRNNPPQFRHLRPLQVSAEDVAWTLARLEKPRGEAPLAWRVVDSWPGMVQALPPRHLFTERAWSNVAGYVWGARGSKGAAGKVWSGPEAVSVALRSELWQKALLSGLLTREDAAAAGVTSSSMRAYIGSMPERERDALFSAELIPVHNETFSVLELRWLAWRLQTLRQFDCLDLVSAKPVVAVLREHQVRNGKVSEGRRPLENPKLVDGLFLATGYDLFRDTYYALICLDELGALDQIDRAACVDGILRFHLGRGVFGCVSADPNGGFPRGDAQSAFFAYESLRLLQALNRVKDLDRWEFRPSIASWRASAESSERVLTAEEIEAWQFQVRLRRCMARRQSNSQVPLPGLLTRE